MKHLTNQRHLLLEWVRTIPMAVDEDDDVDEAGADADAVDEAVH